MTLDGTNTWVLAGPGAAGSAIVDPGPPDDTHLRAILDAGPIEAIILTHRHLDHSESVDRLLELLGRPVPVFAADAALARDTTPLRDGDRYTLGGVAIEVLGTPGHTADSVCLFASTAEASTGQASTGQASTGEASIAEASIAEAGDSAGGRSEGGGSGGERAVLTGDTILGRGTTVVAWPDGDLGDYLASLRRLGALDGVPVLPGHGPVLADCGQVAREYLAHREARLVQVRAALDAGARSPAEVVSRVYPDLEPALVPAAEWTVRAALAYLDPP